MTALTGTAFAATVDMSVDHFNRSEIGAAHTAMSDFLGGVSVKGQETFEGVTPGATKVGRFSSFGGAGSGNSVVGDSSKLQIRGDNDMAWGRYSTSGSSLGGKWLDSNDNLGMKWTVSGVGKFDTLAFYVLDAADVGGKFSIKVGDTLYSNIAGAGGKLANGNIQLVKIMLSEAVSKLTVELMHDRTNDGFGIDGASVGLAPVPLPPAALLLGSGLVGLVALRRRRAATTA